MLNIENVSKIFKNNHKTLKALQDTSLVINKQEIVSLVGQSGCGKSTLLRIIAGLEKTSSGQIKLNNKIITKPSSSISMVFQEPRLMQWLNVFDNIRLSILSDSVKTQRFKINDTLKRVGLENMGSLWPRELSGGMAQRVAIARALAMHPEAILFDEPTSALDPELIGSVLQTIRSLANEGMTMVIVTHEINFARDVADRIIYMDKGIIAEQGPSKILESPKSERLKQFLSSMDEEI